MHCQLQPRNEHLVHGHHFEALNRPRFVFLYDTAHVTYISLLQARMDAGAVQVELGRSHRLSPSESVPHVLVLLRSCRLGQQPACMSIRSPLPLYTWSQRVCSEDTAHCLGMVPLTSTGPFKHAFELLCSCLLARSVDVICAVLPGVLDSQAVVQARMSVQQLLEEFLTCAALVTVSLLALMNASSPSGFVCTDQVLPCI
jgi:hypothetical protein